MGKTDWTAEGAGNGPVLPVGGPPRRPSGVRSQPTTGASEQLVLAFSGVAPSGVSCPVLVASRRPLSRGQAIRAVSSPALPDLFAPAGAAGAPPGSSPGAPGVTSGDALSDLVL